MTMCYSIQVEMNLDEIAKSLRANYSKNTEDFFQENPNPRVYKNKYSPAIIMRKGQREIVPLRYNLLPSFCESDKYQFFNQQKNKYEELSTYNAKIENIERTKAFEKLFMNHHCVVPIKGFFEWVKVDGKSREMRFFPGHDGEFLFAAGVWDHWGPMNLEEGVNSFAIITTPPRAEVKAAGHHRSPLLLKEEFLDEWLAPHKRSKATIQNVVNNPLDSALRYEFSN